MVIIEPSILAADSTRLGEQAKEAESGGADALHIDIMDGRFVPNFTFGPHIIKALRSAVRLPFHVHLMILEPERYIDAFVSAGADYLTVHQEVSPHLNRTLSAIHGAGAKAGVALNPSTPIDVLEEVLDSVDLILIMTVNPGYGGQSFITSQIDKIRRLRTLLKARGLESHIAVDGGIDASTVKLCVDAGADILAAGSSVFNHIGSVETNIAALRAAL